LNANAAGGIPGSSPPQEKEFDWAFCNSELEN
jgi:ankyrin repeat protein